MAHSGGSGGTHGHRSAARLPLLGGCCYVLDLGSKPSTSHFRERPSYLMAWPRSRRCCGLLGMGCPHRGPRPSASKQGGRHPHMRHGCHCFARGPVLPSSGLLWPGMCRAGSPLCGPRGSHVLPTLQMLLAEFYKGAPDLVRFQEPWSQEHTYRDKLKVSARAPCGCLRCVGECEEGRPVPRSPRAARLWHTQA